MSEHQTEVPDHDALEPEGLLDEYRALAESIRQDRPDDVGRQLPGLVDTIVSESVERPEIIRFHVGISVSANHTLFDYCLDRVSPLNDENHRVEPIKEPISTEHHYLSFTYPRDPHFDVDGLRGALLSTLDRRIRELEGSTNDRGEDRLSDVWGLMGGKLDES